MKTKMIIVAAPSGAGKSSFVERVVKEDPRLVDIITFTTRSPRKGESQGHPYYFVTKEEFINKRDANFFVEWAQVHNNLYGTPLDQIETAWAANKCVIMDVDVQGTATFKRLFPESKSIFILPPSIEELKKRIIKRDGGIPKDIDVRMTNAEREMLEAHKFDFQLVNEIFQESYSEFKKIIESLLS